ncbi:DNA repair and recombination protein RAD54-like [Selaginella moellendorffii]|uniref:DNA repair and recombination protein RAD54-like n=1 Tax=Selaginella moellendorffii TaxID=88036 RepID=UPI000D1C7E7D|nr:DNA repair and recombination protein RAD54-like [Selaginella moellendorffii]|eukprot:XP_024526981.1 DNA repair and recombination protein RAD54-like [Selaginella moellendorffii]
MEVIEVENAWPDVDGFLTRIVMETSARSSVKPPLPLRPALCGDMDPDRSLLSLGGSDFSGGSSSISRKSVSAASSASKKLCVEVPWRYFEVMYSVKKKNSRKPGPRSDGVLAVQGSSYNLLDKDGFQLCDRSIGRDPRGRVPQREDLLNEQAYLSFFRRIGHYCRVRSESWKKDQLVLNMAEVANGAAPVVVDPYIASKLRPHQREGVKFMYECVMGLRSRTFTGCLLADEMGLGKTVQVIALIWTLLRQGSGGVPAVRRAAVVCPLTLTRNWGKEVRKWLGSERLKAMVVDCAREAAEKIIDFKNDSFCPLLITSYEILRKHKDIVASTNLELLICDEAHRLKSCKGNKTIASLASLNCNKRILLTGTPAQNNLSEFYALLDFANPELLGSYNEYKNIYASPIEQSRDRNASHAEKELGSERSEELKQMTSFCILRRTSEINKEHLPPKSEYAVFCKLHDVQISLYEIFVKSQFVRTMLNSDIQRAHVLSAIGALRKLSSHPGLLQSDMKHVTSAEIKNQPFFHRAEELLDLSDVQASLRDVVRHDWSLSGKFVCLQHLLLATIQCNDRIVIASNFTQTLDLIEAMCNEHSWKFVRLDGGTMISERQSLVERFNRRIGEASIFLLSSKAGGTGLNLIGANRLVLVDPDWNPANDAQVMSRIWREGQPKPVKIYRLLSTGSIEEKIYQRQIMKKDLTSFFGDQSTYQPTCKRTNDQKFSRQELRELLKLPSETKCETYDLLCRLNTQLEDKWKDSSGMLDDHVLQSAVESGVTTFVSADSPQTQQSSGGLERKVRSIKLHCASINQHRKRMKISPYQVSSKRKESSSR